MIVRGEVQVNGQAIRKPAALVGSTETIAITSSRVDYVSRGALKLDAGIRHFGLRVAGRTALDLGASTGGFTETLLLHGAARVYAVENGHGQLHPKMVADRRVTSLEGVDARQLDRTMIPDPIGAIVADLSFISLVKVLDAAFGLATPGCWLIALVKPQFEAGPGEIPRDGVVKDEAQRQRAVEKIATWIAAHPRWRVLGVCPSPIHGGDGNVEYLLGAEHDG